MRVHKLRALMILVLLIVIGGWGLGLLLGPALSQGQQQDPNCPQADCPDKPKHDPPSGKWVLVNVHVGKGKVNPPCDPDKSPVVDAAVFLLDPQTKNPLPLGSQKPANGQTDKQGRYAAYVALPDADWKHVEVQVDKPGLKLEGVTNKTTYDRVGAFVSPETRLKGIACMDANPGAGRLKLTLWPRAGVPGQGDLPLPSIQQATVGGWMCVNLDNDDRDGQFDLKQQNVNGEDDLVKLVIEQFAGAPPNAQVQLKANKGGNKIRVWDSATKANQINLPAQFPANVATTVWIEGVASSAAPRDVELELVPAAPANWKPQSDKVSLTVIAVQKLGWKAQGNSLSGDPDFSKEEDKNKHPTGTVGIRVFPDAPTPGQPARDKVTLQVTLSAPVPAEFKLYLRALDVDDPSSDSAQLDPNDITGAVNPCPNAPNENCFPNTTIRYTPHEDNRGSAGVKSGQFVGRAPDVEVPATALTDPQGVQYFPATVTFKAGDKVKSVDLRVSKQPGDNFRVLASCDPKFLDDAINLDKDHKLDIYNAPAKQAVSWQSEVLTVWRRLHIERDSMQAPPNRAQPCPGGWVVNQNTVCGRITNVAAGPGANQSTVTTDQVLEDTNQYENGRLTLGPPPARQFPTVGNSQGANATVSVQNDATGAPPANQPFDLHDDDNDAILPKLPDLGWMQNDDDKDKNLFAMAYIRPIDDGGGNLANNQQNIAFRANVLDSQELAQANQGRNSTNTNDFWVSYVQAVFQGWIDADNDPNVEGALLGLCRGCLTSTENGALIYLETLRDGTQATGLNQLDIERGTIVHEIGHQFKGRHPDIQGSFGPPEPDDDIMGWAWFTNPANRRFNDRNLNQIRSICRPGVVAAAGGICPP